MQVQKPFISNFDSHEINEFISKLMLTYNHNDVAKMVVGFIYDLESERSCLAQQSILSFA